jgi:thiamine-monophosphate kinase
MPPRRGSLKRGYYSSSTCLRRFSDPPHTAKRDTFLLLGEHALLARLLARLPRPSPTVLVGPGDDAAVVAGSRNERLVVTTDAVVEGVHFSRAYSTPADIGHRALAVNLSDLAAMGATPRWALLSLMLPGSIREADVEEIVDGLAALAGRYGVSVVGGNITRTDGPLIVDVTAAGEVAPRKWLTRAGARAGDEIWVSGALGGAAAGLEMLPAFAAKGSFGEAGSEGLASCIARHKRPEPRVKLGIAVARARAARAAMDLSDGLADALEQVATASGVGVRIDAAALPIDSCAREWWTARGADPARAAVAGGDDYELLLAVPRKARGALRTVRQRVADPPLTKIGEFTKDPRERVLIRAGKEEELPKGFEHFANR